eukprot:TRINITY_DN12044_c0_g1_i1.p9 TRINITY_DN12044_c0_g1~~TRINITY_DN12044_c0_g1_i1.p9  ORF type:complete len:152 (-),score=12.57 TRINITY_DN12044_c0_g1_i1:5303-5758(-)
MFSASSLNHQRNGDAVNVRLQPSTFVLDVFDRAADLWWSLSLSETTAEQPLTLSFRPQLGYAPMLNYIGACHAGRQEAPQCAPQLRLARTSYKSHTTSAVIFVNCAMDPGRSGTSIRNLTRRPSAASPRSKTRPMTGTSMLPPGEEEGMDD